MKYLMGLIAFTTMSSAVFANDKPVEGGFGVKLGNNIEQRLVEQCSESKEATTCIFKPDETHPIFTQYYVTLDPKESKVMHIEASTILADGCDAVKEKLGAMYSSELYNFQQAPYLWGYGDKIASLKCDKIGQGYKLSFHLIDTELQSKS